MQNVGSVKIIAEMAWAHNGSVDNAVAIVEGAKEARADAIGLHLTSLPDYMVRHYRCSDGVTTSDRSTSDIYRYLEKLTFGSDGWDRVFTRAGEIGIATCVMCNDEPSLEFASRFKPSIYALAAACFTDFDFVRRIARTNAPVVLRIGGATLGEIEAVLETLRAEGTNDVTLLHGIQLYPTDVGLLNVSALAPLQRVFGCKVGLADHIAGDLEAALYVPLLALAFGASVIEKHITIDRALKHEDFEAALGIAEFRRFVEMVRTAECSLGSGSIGELSEDDMRYRRVSRKRAVARRAIHRAMQIRREDIAFKRSDSGIDAGEVDLLIGRTALKDVDVDEGLDLSAVRRADG